MVAAALGWLAKWVVNGALLHRKICAGNVGNE